MRTWFLAVLFCFLQTQNLPGQNPPGQNLSGLEQPAREAAVLSFGEKLGELQAELRLATLAADKLPSEQKARFEALKKDVASEVDVLKQEVLAQKITIAEAEKRLEKQRNYIGGWVVLGQEKSKPLTPSGAASGKLPGDLFNARNGLSFLPSGPLVTAPESPSVVKPTDTNGPFGNVPVVVTMSPEEYFAYQTFAPMLLEAQKDPAKFKEKINSAVAEIKKQYPEGLGKAIQNQQLEAIRKIKAQLKPEEVILDPKAREKAKP